MRACPYCAEQIQDAAVLCRYCGKSVTPITALRTPVTPSPEWRALRLVLILVLPVLLGVALLYAYRAQSPFVNQVAYSRGVTDIQSGQVARVTISGETAMLDKVDGTREMVTIGSNDGASFQQVVTDYNAGAPADKKVTLVIEGNARPFVELFGAALLGALPVVLIVTLVVYLVLVRQPRRN